MERHTEPLTEEEKKQLELMKTRAPQGKLNDAEVSELASLMDRDLDDFIAEKAAKPKQPKPEDNRSVDEIVEELCNHPAFMTEWDPSKPMTPAMEALMALKYDTEDALENAKNYKDDGNENFKKSKYRWAVDSYSEGIRAKAAEKPINAVLYSNRAASHYHLQNYGSSYRDAVVALRFVPSHMKAIHRAVMCSLKLNRFDQALKWCDEGLQLDPQDSKLLAWRTEAEGGRKQKQRDERKEAAKERREAKQQQDLLVAIKARGVRLQNDVKLPPVVDAPGAARTQVTMQAETLSWPVFFVYPEYSESDFIQSFCETSTFADHIQTMFGAEPPEWDSEQRYKPSRIQIFFEDEDKEKLYEVPVASTLLQALQHEKYVVKGGAPGFIIVSRDSEFARTFRGRYQS